MENGLPKKQGLYDPQFEHDACGIGCIANIKGRKSHGIVNQGIQILKNLAHRGGVGSEPDTGDGAGILIQMPHKFMQKVSPTCPSCCGPSTWMSTGCWCTPSC